MPAEALHDHDPKGAATLSLSKDGRSWAGRYFRVAEFACKDGSDKILLHPKLVELVNAIRERAGAPITVNSGYRTPRYNAKIGGAKASYHTKGMAADLVCRALTPTDIARIAEELGAGGVKAYPTFTHVDVGPVRRW